MRLDNELSKALGKLVKKIDQMGKAAVGDIQLSAVPATFGNGFAATYGTGGWSKKCYLYVKNAAGEILEWFDGSVASSLKLTAATGTTMSASVATLTFNDGVATFTISLGTCATSAGNSATFTIGPDAHPIQAFGASLASVTVKVVMT